MDPDSAGSGSVWSRPAAAGRLLHRGRPSAGGGASQSRNGKQYRKRCGKPRVQCTQSLSLANGKIEGHEAAVRAVLVVAEPSARHETGLRVERPRWRERGPGPRLQAQSHETPGPGHADEIAHHGRGDALSPHRLHGVHGFHFGVTCVEPLERARGDELTVLAQAEERHRRIDESLDVQRMNVLRRALRVHEGEVPDQQFLHIWRPRIVNGDVLLPRRNHGAETTVPSVRVPDAALDDVRTRGFSLIEGFLSSVELEAAQAALRLHFPTREEYFADPGRYTNYAGSQFAGVLEFPYRSWDLNHLAFHPDLVDAAERYLGTRELHLYKVELWAKYAGATNYDQPLHRDYGSHSLVVPREDGRYQQLTTFIYLSDVTELDGPTRVVPFEKGKGVPFSPLYLPF